MKNVLILHGTGNLLTATLKMSPIKKFEKFLESQGKDIRVVMQNFTPNPKSDSYAYALEAIKTGKYDLYLLSYPIAKMWGAELNKKAADFDQKVVTLSPTALAQTEEAQLELLKIIEDSFQ